MSNPRTEVEVALRYLHPDGNVTEALAKVSRWLEGVDLGPLEVERIGTWQDETQESKNE